MTETYRPHVVIVAAENGALDGAKVGGVADVIREVPLALAASTIDVTVLTPSHGFLHELPGARPLGVTEFNFAGGVHKATLYEMPKTQQREPGRSQLDAAGGSPGQITQLVVDHPILSTGHKGQLYQSDPSDRPFARDSTRFACFSAACATIVDHGLGRSVDVLHLHDWHTGYIAILRHSGQLPALAKIRTVFTIHNLAFQGIRPIRDDESSFLAWFPDVEPDAEIIGDPRWPWCVNPLAAAVRLCDAIHVVSPNYAKEIQLPDEAEVGDGTGGCGLEQLLITASAKQRLFGILNGCHYASGGLETDSTSRLNWATLRAALNEAIDQQHVSDTDGSSQRISHVLSNVASTGPAPIITSVGRIGDQKTGLLLQSVDEDRLAIDALLESLGPQGMLIMLGSGDDEMEAALAEAANRHENFLFLCGFSDALADALYRSGDLFLMPSTFEPCGISQMLAMRAGQPCLVHSVGGLKDTIDPQVNGFAFSANTRETQAKALVSTASECFERYRSQPYRDWLRVCEAARQARFEWSKTIDQYISSLYAPAISQQKSKS